MKSVHNKLLNIHCNSILFIAIYSLFTLITYNSFFWQRIASFINFNGIEDYAFLVIYFIAIYALHFVAFSIFFVKGSTKFLAILLILINSSSSYFINTYSVQIDKNMIINVFSTDTKEAFDLINFKFVIQFLCLGVLPSVFIYYTKVVYSKFFKELLYRLISVAVILGIALIFIGSNYRRSANFVRTTNNEFNYLSPNNYVNGIFRVIRDTFYKDRNMTRIADDIKIDNKKPTLVILMIGETSRKANFSLYGYERKTNPLLENDDVVAMKNPTSCGTATEVSVPCLMSHLKQKEFWKANKRYEALPSIVKKAGVDVLYKENNFGGCKRTCAGVETIYTDVEKDKDYCATGECHDAIMLKNLPEYINSKKNNNILIVLHHNGSHGPRYNKRYPAKFEKFSPVCNNNDVGQCSQEELVNAYDNTIVYHDYVMHNVIQIADKADMKAVVLYASDHGESLGEHGLYLHGFPYNLAPKEQKEIPFLVWMSDEFKKSNKLTNSCINKHESYSHDNIFHSVLGAFNAKTAVYDKELDIFRCN